ncbi:MAG: Asp-tRNA(Asn)/Glu-tRNA(Gln) amidotransferase subunit GatA [Planctomycetota bacterium]
MSQALDLPVAEQAARVRDPADPLTARALVDASLARIAARNESLNAFLHVAPERARAAADRIDAEVAAGREPGPLAGVPLAVKDNLDVEGLPLTCGSRILGTWKPLRTATCVARAEAAGAVVVGKTNLDEFAMGSSTENSAFGPSRNPYDLERVPGGSSGGSAAAVAAGLVPLALGSDTGGSIRQPAAFCGIVGFKPTYGRVSRSGLVAFASSLDQVGPFARSVADARRLQAVLEGPDPLDATSRAFPTPGSGPGPTPRSLAGLRIGRVAEMTTERRVVGTEGVDAVEALRTQLGALGTTTVDVDLPAIAEAIAIYYVIAPAEASSNLARFDGVRYGHRAEADTLERLYAKTRAEGFGAEVKRRILLGTFALSAGYADAFYKRARGAQAALGHAFAEAFERCDVLISATTPTAAFRLGEKTGDPLAMYRSDVLTVAANLAGLPAVSIPAGFNEQGLPLGLQVQGPVGADALVLDVAEALERQLATCRYVAPGEAA